MCTCDRSCSLVTIITSISILLIGITLKAYLPNLVENTIMKSVVLSNTSILYGLWVEPTVPIYDKFYVFNYTNHQSISPTWSKGIRPKVNQLGPYVYRHLMRKRNITFISADEVEYYLDEKLVFIPELSNGTEEDMVIFPNVILRGLVQSEQAKADILDVEALLKRAPNTSSDSFIRKSVGSFLFNGYYDPLIEEIHENTGLLSPDGRFSLLKKSSETGPIRIKTGSNKTGELGQIIHYQDKKILDYWPTNSTCNLIKGTDGSLFSPRLSISEKLFIFFNEFCRSIILRYEKKVDHHGLKANRFVLDTDTMANTNQEYECFCNSPINKCWAPGVFNLGQCQNGVPILLSQPHFLNADFKVKNIIDGLAPDPEKHESYMDLEITIGLPLNVSGSIQINLGIERIPHIKSVDILPRMIMPIVWMSKSLDINETMTEMAKSMIIDGPLIVSELVPKAILGLGGFIGLMGILCAIRHMFKATKKRAEPRMDKFVHTFAY